MGKHGGTMTAAAISKRIKAKGLGRLRWYCQMCEKQCRDENGFKCHTQSPSHQRQLALFAENPHDYIDKFSQAFRTEFLTVLRRRYGTSTVHANTVYQECIKDRDHVHMNATKWTTLSDFVKEMGRDGLCRVEEREDGWWLSFIDRSAAEKNRKARVMDRERAAEDERAETLLRRQLENAKRAKLETVVDKRVEGQETAEDGPVSMQLKSLGRKRTTSIVSDVNPLTSSRDDQRRNDQSRLKTTKRKSRFQDSREPSVIDQLMHTGHSGQSRYGDNKVVQRASPGNAGTNVLSECPAGSEQHEAWLSAGIIVKVINKEVNGGLFFGKKGEVLSVIDDFGARVCMLESKSILELDQDDLETVIPKPDGSVLILKGTQRGTVARVRSVNFESYSVSLVALGTGELLPELEYEAVSRVAE